MFIVVSALEDVPVIVPIVIALLLFFGALGYTMDRVNSANESIDLTLKLLELSDLFTQGTIITDDSFSSACQVAETSFPGFGYAVGIVDMDSSPSGNPKDTLRIICLSSPHCVSSNYCSGFPAGLERKTVIVKEFPVVYQDVGSNPPINELKKMVVMIWKA